MVAPEGRRREGMSEVRSGARRLGVAIAVLSLAGYLMLTTLPAQAAALDCTYNAVTRQVTFVLQGDGTIGVDGGDIVADDANEDLTNASQCGTATVNTTDGITVDANGNGGTLTI